jgi:cell division protein FtsB
VSTHSLRAHGQARYALKLPGSGRAWQVALGIAAAILLLALLLAGDKSLIALLGRYQERAQLTGQIEELQGVNQKWRQQVQELEAQPKAVEPIAREELGLVRAGELVYRFVPPRDAERKEKR